MSINCMKTIKIAIALMQVGAENTVVMSGLKPWGIGDLKSRRVTTDH